MKTPTKILYFAYLRKSSEKKERQALSIPAQKARIQQQFPDLDIVFIEESASAFKPYNRPLFADMIKEITHGKRTGLIGWHPDRLSRNEIDAATITFMIRSGTIADMKFCSYTFENGPEGIWMLQMALSQSQYDSAKKGRDVKRGLRQKANIGNFPGPAPEGYINITLKDGKKIIVEDPKSYPLLRKATDLLLTGQYSIPRLQSILNNEWGYRTKDDKPIGRSTLYFVYYRTFYYGDYQYPAKSGEWYKGTHKPLMTEEEFDKIQLILRRKNREKPKKHRFDYRGPFVCGECGSSVTAETKVKRPKNGKVHTYVYYHCTKHQNKKCTQGSIEEKELKRQLDTYLANFEVPESMKTWAIEGLKKLHSNEVFDREHIRAQHKTNYDRAVRMIDRYIDMRANNEITEDELAEKKAKLIKEKNDAKEALDKVDHRINHWLEVADKCLNFAEKARTAFDKGTAETKKTVIEAIGSNLTLIDKKVRFEAHQTLFTLEIAKKIASEENLWIEPLDAKQYQLNIALANNSPRM